MSSFPAQLSYPQPPQGAALVRSATVAPAPAKHPWLVAAFLTTIFFLAAHDFRASQIWQETTSRDVSTMVTRISEGNWMRQLAFLALAGAGTIGVLLPANRRRRFRLDLLILYPLVLLASWCVLSVLWSHAPALTAKRLIVFYAIAAAICAVVKRYGLGVLVPIAFFYGCTSLVLGVCAEAALRTNPFVTGYRFAGTQHPNHTGLAMVLLVLSSLALAGWNDRRKRIFFLVAGIAAIVLIVTGSRTALFAGAFAAMVMTVLRWPLRRLLLVGVPIAWTIALFGTMYSLELVPPIWEKALLAREDADVTTLTGRTDIWHFTLRHLAKNEERILIGFGYDSFWTPQMAYDVSKFVQFKISEGHSAYIDATMETGVIGAGLYVFCLLVTFGRWCAYAWKTKAAAAAFAAAIPAVAIVHGFAESAFIDAHLWTLLLFSTMAFAGLARPPANALSRRSGVTA
jgi:exopolysaccharide production protein ExoQ